MPRASRYQRSLPSCRYANSAHSSAAAGSFECRSATAHWRRTVPALADLTTYAEALDEEIVEITTVLDAVRARELPEAYWIGGAYLLHITVAQRD